MLDHLVQVQRHFVCEVSIAAIGSNNCKLAWPVLMLGKQNQHLEDSEGVTSQKEALATLLAALC